MFLDLRERWIDAAGNKFVRHARYGIQGPAYAAGAPGGAVYTNATYGPPAIQPPVSTQQPVFTSQPVVQSGT